MRLELRGHHVDVTPALKRLVDSKLTKLERLLNASALSAQTILTLEKHRHRADITLHGNARDAVAWLTHWVEAWQDAIAGLDEDAAMTIGLSQANELDAAEPFGHVVLRLNRELIHHGSEIMTLQDLYAVAA